MCGIFGILRYNNGLIKSIDKISSAFMSCSARGPESSVFRNDEENNVILGFHRLAINGYNKPSSEQPLVFDNCVLICNGEIYNWRELSKQIGVDCTSGSDCEIIIHMYKKYGIETTLQKLDGVFAFMLWDKQTNKVYLARDAYGVRPLFIWYTNNNPNGPIGFASELKMCKNVFDHKSCPPKPFTPGCYLEVDITPVFNLKKSYQSFLLEDNLKPYHLDCVFENTNITSIQDTEKPLRDLLSSAVKKRVENSDREIACLLSGGLDSSLIAALVAREFNEKYGLNGAKKLHTWSIGMEGSEDLRYAKIVAEHIGSTHHEIVLRKF